MTTRSQAERQLANLALFDTQVHKVIPFDDLHRIESHTCRAIVEACIVARVNGFEHGDTDADLLNWQETITRACDGNHCRVKAYLRHAYRAPVDRVYLTTADAWAVICEYGPDTGLRENVR